jgi:hypothetical protein
MRNRLLQLCGTGVLAGLMTVTGCHKADTNAAGATDPNDPAAQNLAPVNGTANDSVGGTAQYPANSSPAYSSPKTQRTAGNGGAMPPAPPQDTGNAGNTGGNYADNGQYAQPSGQADADQGYQGYQSQGYANGQSDGYGDDGGYYQPVYAEQPPPQLPEYQQPPCPGDNYLWTPGYWNYAQAGYFWVPGVWVVAPFIGALWTPGYWGYENNRYGFHHGYWGDHIGYYGGVAYGNGYYGHGYEGGYWNHDNFYYNRSVTRVNTTIVRNVYEHNVLSTNNYSRVSYNGGRGGLEVKPQAYELAAAREQHFGALPAQREHVQQAMANHANFASANGGRPQTHGGDAGGGAFAAGGESRRV